MYAVSISSYGTTSASVRYPYSARELLAVIRHLERFPNEPLEEVPCPWRWLLLVDL